MSERNAISVKDFCWRNSIGRTTVYKQIKEGQLRIKKVGRRTLISRAEEERWLGSSANSLNAPIEGVHHV